MALKPVDFRSPLAAYEQQAVWLLSALRAGDPAAIDCFHGHHPRFLDDRIKWRRRSIPAAAIREAALELDDARLTVARSYDFQDWTSLAAHVEAVACQRPVLAFEAAVEAVINGDVAALTDGLGRDPTLARARSTRICCFEPPKHHATLLHYVAANGVERYRQKTPHNAVEVARLLLEAGAEVDAVADMYATKCTVMTMLVSSSHPAAAGVQVALVELLLEFGAAINGSSTKSWDTPLFTALAFGMNDAAKALAERGARIELAAAAGLGLIDQAARLIEAADAEARHRAFSLAAQHGHAEIVGLLLDAGEDPNRYNLNGNHGHTTPLHQAALGGHEAVVRLLVERGARLDLKDTIWQGSPLGWALHAGGKAQQGIAAYLRSRGAADEDR